VIAYISEMSPHIVKCKQTYSKALLRTLNKKFVNFGPTAAKLRWPMCTHPESNVHTIWDNFTLWSWILVQQNKISRIGNKLFRLTSLRRWAKHWWTLVH